MGLWRWPARREVRPIVEEAEADVGRIERAVEEWRVWWRRAGERELRCILMTAWDPIGVGDAPEAWDEYDSYVGGVGRRLLEAADPDRAAEAVAGYLDRGPSRGCRAADADPVSADLGLLSAGRPAAVEEGWAGIVAPSAARPKSLIACVFMIDWPPTGCNPLDNGLQSLVPYGLNDLISSTFNNTNRWAVLREGSRCTASTGAAR
jgi:hypothetical protein